MQFLAVPASCIYLSPSHFNNYANKPSQHCVTSIKYEALTARMHQDTVTCSANSVSTRFKRAKVVTVHSSLLEAKTRQTGSYASKYFIILQHRHSICRKSAEDHFSHKNWEDNLSSNVTMVYRSSTQQQPFNSGHRTGRYHLCNC